MIKYNLVSIFIVIIPVTFPVKYVWILQMNWCNVSQVLLKIKIDFCGIVRFFFCKIYNQLYQICNPSNLWSYMKDPLINYTRILVILRVRSLNHQHQSCLRNYKSTNSVIKILAVLLNSLFQQVYLMILMSLRFEKNLKAKPTYWDRLEQLRKKGQYW